MASDDYPSSSSASIPVRLATEADLPQVAETLAAAFDDDPVMNWLVRQDARRRWAMHAVYVEETERMSFPYGGVAISEDGSGAALWQPPGVRPRVDPKEAASMLRLMLRIAGWERLPRMLAEARQMAQARPKEPHYFLSSLGVRPERQGSGVGSALLELFTARCDAEGVPAFLESSKARNLPLYERYGFQVTKEARVPLGGPIQWLMLRQPR